MSMIINPYAFSTGTTGRWNPLDKGSLIVVTSSDRDIENSGGTVNWDAIRSVTSHNSGKHYAENKMTGFGGGLLSNIMFGVATSGMSITDYVGAAAGSWSIQNDVNCSLRLAGAITGTTLMEMSAVGQAQMVAYDAALGYVWLGSNGAFYNSGDPAAGTNPTVTITPGTTLYLALSIARSGYRTTLCNVPGENIHTIPSGFSMWG